RCRAGRDILLRPGQWLRDWPDAVCLWWSERGHSRHLGSADLATQQPGNYLELGGRQAHPQRQAAKVAIVSFRAGPAREGHMWLVRSWLIGLIAAISLLAQGASKAEPVKIRVSWIAPLSNWASLLMEKKEIARHMGRTYILEPVRYAGTPQMITALASNELEIANLAFSTLPIAIH